MNPVTLFSGATAGAATVLAIACFVLGAVVMCLVCKLTHGACGKKCAAPRPQQKRADRPQQPTEKRHAPPADGSIEIYVGNLSYDMTEDQLRQAFEAYGKVNAARIVTTRDNRSKGYGFVHMPVRAEAEAAVKALNDTEMLGRKIRCNEAHN